MTLGLGQVKALYATLGHSYIINAINQCKQLSPYGGR